MNKKNAFTVPLWKWILLHFVKTHVGFDSEGNFATVCYMKMLFKELYVWRLDIYRNGKVIDSRKLERVNYE